MKQHTVCACIVPIYTYNIVSESSTHKVNVFKLTGALANRWNMHNLLLMSGSLVVIRHEKSGKMTNKVNTGI